MSQKITIQQSSASVLKKAGHILFALPEKQPADLVMAEVLAARMKRKGTKYNELAKSPLTADLPHGGLASWVVLGKSSTFEQHTALRRALAPLLEESPETLTIVLCDSKQAPAHARMALYVALVNAVRLPNRKKKQSGKPLKKIQLVGLTEKTDFSEVQAVAAGNVLTRGFTVLPPNDLTPALYREKIRALADENGWTHEEFDMKKLRKMGAGAFVAVAQGSDPEDAAIVHLTYTPKKAKAKTPSPSMGEGRGEGVRHVALVGKGICFDTGGHNLKPARYMHGMHEDMNGSAVALGTLLAATQAKLPVKIDCWLAIAQNHISPKAYKQNDVVTALNGTTIEVIHTDAEGRMVLADTLTLASRGKPDLMLDFATLTGSMITALGNRYSGILGNRPELLCKAVGAGQSCGERVNAFPLDSDYDEELESKVADIKQCTLDGEADHILAARFLSKFIEGDVPWLHVDLAASNHKGGLGAVGSAVTGFGVAFALGLLRELSE